MPGWIVAFAAPTEMHWTMDNRGPHFPAERKINYLGHETYVTRETRAFVRNHRKITRILPLLGPYIFVRATREWGDVASIEGIHDVLQSAGEPVKVMDAEVDKLRRAEDAGVFDFTKPFAAFNRGDAVEIMEGPFAALIARVRSASPRKRVRLFLNGLQIEMDADKLRKAG